MAALAFADFNFKLMVLNELMYRRRSIPPFDLAKLEAEIGKKLYERGSWAVPEDDYEGFVPEIAAWFERYEVTAEMVAGIESLEWVGEQIQQDVAPNWGGEDDRFDMTVDSAKDLPLLPELRQVRAIYDRTNEAAVVEAFAAHSVSLRHPYA